MKEQEMQEFKGAVACNISAKRMWRASCEDAHNCLPKALPNAISSIEYEGDPFQPGCYRTIHYKNCYAKLVSKENCLKHLVEYTKERLVEIDDNSHTLKLEVVNGGFLGIFVTSYNYSIQFAEGSLPDTCVAKICYEFKPISPEHHRMMCEKVKEIIPISVKWLEAYLLTNDDYQD